MFQIFAEEDGSTSVAIVSDFVRGKHLQGVAFSTLADLSDYVAREDILQSDSTMVKGEMTFHGISNHDLVEPGQATYSDVHRVFVDLLDERTEGTR